MGEVEAMSNFWEREEKYKAELASLISGGLKMAILDSHGAAKKAGWYTDRVTGKPLDRNPGEMIALMHSELSEMLEGVRKGAMDSHLPHRRSEEVEAADLLIRLLDYAGYRGLDIVGAYLEKREYNDAREDHSLANRRKEGGKAF
jgi:NTP pyrophosphatase (non-canonical NTP hydrolase)